MDIKITLGSDEVKEINRKHALRNFPQAMIDKNTHEVYVVERYGAYDIEVSDKLPAGDEEENNDK